MNRQDAKMIVKKEQDDGRKPLLNRKMQIRVNGKWLNRWETMIQNKFAGIDKPVCVIFKQRLVKKKARDKEEKGQEFF